MNLADYNKQNFNKLVSKKCYNYYNTPSRAEGGPKGADQARDEAHLNNVRFNLN